MNGTLIEVVAALALAGCGGGDDAPKLPDGPPRETIEESVSLVVTQVSEAILHGGEGDVAHIMLTAPGPTLDWNMHGHANGGTQVVTEAFKVETVDYVFAPSDLADWYVLLRNKGQTDITVELKIDLYGEMTWSGWQ
ncbi:MAG: hypothetical protein AB7P03_08460 [Kofleriaceae bacterium]